MTAERPSESGHVPRAGQEPAPAPPHARPRKSEHVPRAGHEPAPAPPDAPTIGPIDLQRGGADPLHLQIERAFRENIVTGSWPARARLPREPELAATLGVNRGTLRRALSALVAAGLLVAVRGRGTFVSSAVLEPSIAQRFRSLSEDFTAQGFAFHAKVRSSVLGPLPLPVQTLLGVPAGTPGLRLERVFVGEAGPLAFLVNYVRADGCPDIAEVDFTRQSLFGTLEHRYGLPIVRGRRTFSAQRASLEVAGALHVAAGDPVLYLEQVSYATGGRAVEYSDVWIDSSRVTITSMLQRDPA
jgi:GntR family transcriptional regulator